MAAIKKVETVAFIKAISEYVNGIDDLSKASEMYYNCRNSDTVFCKHIVTEPVRTSFSLTTGKKETSYLTEYYGFKKLVELLDNYDRIVIIGERWFLDAVLFDAISKTKATVEFCYYKKTRFEQSWSFPFIKFSGKV